MKNTSFKAAILKMFSFRYCLPFCKNSEAYAPYEKSSETSTDKMKHESDNSDDLLASF